MVSSKKFLETVIDDFKNNEYNFNRLEEMNIITIANKVVMSYDFYKKHNMHAVEWKLISKINKNRALIKKFYRNWRHQSVRKVMLS